jgi:EAL domain-containing protein (putative c-di-GMP-specific phosphodiesterase class I)/CRP-like cAMP-binding protein
MTDETTPKKYAAGSVIMRQGEDGNAAYMIENGKVEILINSADGQEHRVGTRGKGAMIGEMALVDNAPRTATIRAIEDCELLEITKDDFSRRLNSADPVLKMTAQVIMTRYRDTLARSEILNRNNNAVTPEALELSYTSESNAIENIKMANDLKDALSKEELYLNYQPIIDLKTGKISGFESLMRWDHPTRGFVSPGEFIPVAEETGLIVEASKWGLKEACSALNRLESHTGLHGSLFMSINFSSEDFASDDFVNTVSDTISTTDLKAEQVHLEITERLLMVQPDNAKETLSMLRDAGMGISIDDFGTGYSSLSYLHYFPIDILKIDQSFTRDMLNNKGSMELVKSIISLAQNLGMKVIAEGVEHKEEGQKLRELGCDMAQGYYFARPISEKAVTELVQNWTGADL